MAVSLKSNKWDSIPFVSFCRSDILGRHDIQYNDIQHNDTLQDDIQQNGTQHNDN
jgi:hypothetical protein